jgi:peptidoglycan/LPS O-acetylase OafA/YrhL
MVKFQPTTYNSIVERIVEAMTEKPTNVAIAATPLRGVSPGGRESADSWAALGGLRFLLATIVVCAHINVLAYHMANPWLGPIGNLSAFAAVIAFFVISGYSIAASLEREPAGFYRRRFVRIAPAFWAAFLFSLLPIVIFGWSICPPEYRTDNFPALALNGVCLQTFLTPQSWFFGPSWTLAVTLVCYVLAPVFNKFSTGWLVLIGGVSAAAYLAHAYYFGRVDYWDEYHGISTVCLMWAWIGGFVYYRHRSSLWAKALLIALCPLLAQLNPFANAPLTWLTVLVAMVVLIAAPSFRIKSGIATLLRYLGELSYPLYLVQFPFIIMLYNAIGKTSQQPWTVYFAGCLLLSACIVHLLERPIKRHFTSRNSAPIEAAVAHQ